MFDYSFLITPISLSPVDSNKVRAAKEAFTTPVVEAPWNKTSNISTTLISLAAEAKRTKNFVEPVDRLDGRMVGDKDLQTSFTVFKALDRLNNLAKLAAEKTVGSIERESLNEAFQRGMSQLQGYLASADTDKLSFTFEKPTSTVSTVKIPSPTVPAKGNGILEVRADPIPGLIGNEVLTINLSKSGVSHSVDVDLSTINGPITLDAVAEAANAAISSIPLEIDGEIVYDSNNQPVSRYITRFEVKKHGEEWGFSFNSVETETVSLQEASAGNAIVVASSETPLEGVTSGRIIKITDPEGEMGRGNMGTIIGMDREATSIAKLTPSQKVVVEGVDPPSTDIQANTSPKAVAVTDDGYTYVVGTTEGDIGTNQGTGQSDLFLSKMDSEGKVIWQRQLGAFGASEGNAITVDKQGNVYVTGSTTAALNDSDVFDGQDAVVAKYNASGDEIFSTQIDGLAKTSGTAIVVDDAGNIFMAGNVNGQISGQTASGGQDTFVIKLSSDGAVQTKTQFGTSGHDSVGAIALHTDGSLIIASNDNGEAVLRKLDPSSLSETGTPVTLGSGTISSIAVDKTTGAIAIGGTARETLASGSAVNAHSGGSDGFVIQLGSDLTIGNLTYLGTSGSDSVDSLTFMDGTIYAGGRTNDIIGDKRTGSVDAFVARLNTDGSIANVHQYGSHTTSTGPVVIAAAKGGDTVLGKLGLQQGQINQPVSDKLVSQTTLRAGDSFTIQAGTSRKANIVIQEDDTFDTLASRIRLQTGYKINLNLSKLSTGWSMTFTAKADQPIELTAGPDGKDALKKLGLAPAKLRLPKPSEDGAVITPGGNYSLNLNAGYALKDQASSGFVLKKLGEALDMVKSGYRSLYWDDTKAALVDGTLTNPGQGSAYQQLQLANYQAALTRLSG